MNNFLYLKTIFDTMLDYLIRDYDLASHYLDLKKKYWVEEVEQQLLDLGEEEKKQRIQIQILAMVSLLLMLLHKKILFALILLNKQCVTKIMLVNFCTKHQDIFFTIHLLNILNFDEFFLRIDNFYITTIDIAFIFF